ncbi:Alternative oxidase [Diplonema papillatum]|nr:Alternative oxidase [Diplonema papillatum]
MLRAAAPAARFALAAQRRGCLGQGDNHGSVHFRLTPNAHPLGKSKKVEMWDNPTQNHVWEPEELAQKLKVEAAQPVHVPPKGIMDRITYGAVRTCYHAFNFITGYNKADPSTKSIVYRVLILESIAGCPGMVAAGVRHFRSLR